MRVSLKYALPIAQMVIAAALWWCDDRWQLAAMRVADMPGPSSPAFYLLLIINWPLAPLRMLWFWHVPPIWDEAVSLATVGLFWYLVSVNLGSLRERGNALVFTWMPLRIAGDLLFIAVGIVIGVLCTSTVMRGPRPYYIHLWSEWLWFGPTVAMEIIWSSSLLFIFVSDAVYCLLHRKPIANLAP